MTRIESLALVESATQLLNVAEWAYANGAADGLPVAVLAPAEKRTVRQLERVAGVVSELGLDIRFRPVRSRSAAAVLGGSRVLGAMARARQLIIGDPFSRFIQTLLPACSADEVVVVDDGTATWEYVRCIDAGKPLVRWGVPLSGAERRATRAGRLLSPSEQRRITVFSCLSDATPLAGTGLANRYEWTRSWSQPTVVHDEVDVLGVSLVDNGVIHRAAYVAAVGRLVTRHAPVRYVAHRRESDSLVSEIAALPGVRVVRNDLPVELALRQGSVARHIVAFPSTAAHTLPVVLHDIGVRVEVHAIAPDWFTPTTTSHARAFVARIADVRPVRRPLQIVS